MRTITPCFYILTSLKFGPHRVSACLASPNLRSSPHIFENKTQVNCKICLKSAGLHESFGWFWLVLCCGVWRQVTNKKCLNFEGLSRQETIGQRFSIHCSKIGHSNEALTYLFGWNIFISLLLANKHSPVDLWKLAITGKFRSIRDSTLSFLQDLEIKLSEVPGSRKNLWGSAAQLFLA